jgi:hypothetical protein
MTVKRAKSRKTFEKLKDVIHDIGIRSAKIKDAKINSDAGKAATLLEQLANEIQMEDKDADPNTIRVVC